MIENKESRQQAMIVETLENQIKWKKYILGGYIIRDYTALQNLRRKQLEIPVDQAMGAFWLSNWILTGLIFLSFDWLLQILTNVMKTDLIT